MHKPRHGQTAKQSNCTVQNGRHDTTHARESKAASLQEPPKTWKKVPSEQVPAEIRMRPAYVCVCVCVCVLLDDDYLGRAWCLAECGQYTRDESKCEIAVDGKAGLKPGSDFLREMKAGVTADLPLIEAYTLDMFESKEAFNQAIDLAVVML